jgi:flagellar hook-length control protein FliK
MTNLLLALLTPNVSAEKGEKANAMLGGSPFEGLAEMPVSFKEVLALSETYGPAAKSLAQMKQDLQALQADARIEAHLRFLGELSDGEGLDNPFAGLAAVPGMIPQAAQATYHSVAGVVDAISATADVPATSLPLQAMPLDAYASPEDLAALPVGEALPESTDGLLSDAPDMGEASLDLATTAPEGGADVPLMDNDAGGQDTGTRQGAGTASAANAAASDDDVLSLAATRTAAMAPAPAATLTTTSAADSGMLVMAQAMATEAPAEFALPLGDQAAVPTAETRAAQGERVLSNAFGLEEVAPEPLAQRMAPAEETLTSQSDARGPARDITTPPGIERAEPHPRALDQDAPGMAVAAANGRPFEAALASTSQAVQLQLSVRPQQPLGEQLRVHIRSSVAEGHDQIRIHLKPESLGSIDISIALSQDGSAQVRVVSDNLETFDLLQRDARGLERALNEAGIKADAGSLQFQLRDGGQGQQAQNQSAGSDGRGYGQRDDGQGQGRGTQRGDAQDIVEMEDNGMYRLVATTGLNIRV